MMGMLELRNLGNNPDHLAPAYVDLCIEERLMQAATLRAIMTCCFRVPLNVIVLMRPKMEDGGLA